MLIPEAVLGCRDALSPHFRRGDEPTHPKKAPGFFAPFEWMIAARYLRAKRQESFVSVISGYSLVGIALGVATLIIVMSVMGGFRKEFLASILGFNGHVTVQAAGGLSARL